MKRGTAEPAQEEKRLTLLDLMVLLKDVQRQISGSNEKRFARDWLVGVPASESTPAAQLRWLAERFSYAHANRSQRRSLRAILAPPPESQFGRIPFAPVTQIQKPTTAGKDDAWEEICKQAERLAALDLHTTSLPEAIQALLDRIETNALAGNKKSLIQLASLLIQLEAAKLADKTELGMEAQQMVRTEQAKRRAEALLRHQEIHGPAIPRAKPTIAEPEETLTLTIFDLVRVMVDVLKAAIKNDSFAR